MAKASLGNVLDKVPPAPAAQAAPELTKAPTIPSREGTALVGAHLPSRFQKAMKLLSAETDKSQRVLLEEALNMLFVKYGAKF